MNCQSLDAVMLAEGLTDCQFEKCRIRTGGVKRQALCENKNMNDEVYFEGDPATDSARRHMERVLKAPESASRWPWLLAALGSGGVWMLWRWGQAAARTKAPPERNGPPE